MNKRLRNICHVAWTWMETIYRVGLSLKQLSLFEGYFVRTVAKSQVRLAAREKLSCFKRFPPRRYSIHVQARADVRSRLFINALRVASAITMYTLTS